MSFEKIKGVILESNTSLDNDEYWERKESALIISFTNTNSGDLHKSVREAFGYNLGSNKTHIDITSGNDIEVGHSPVLDFLDARTELGDRVYTARLNRRNIEGLGVFEPFKADWKNFNFHIKPFLRNAESNPSVQLLQKDDLLPLRQELKLGQSLVFLKDAGGIFDVLGVDTNAQLKEVLGSKTKRMFLNESNLPAGSAGDAVLIEKPSISKGTKLKPSDIEAKPSRVQDPLVRRAIELRGMEVVREHFEGLGNVVTNVHTAPNAVAMGLEPYPGFDQLVVKDGVTFACCETKATTTNGYSVEITINELDHLLHNPNARLCVVGAISLSFDPDSGDPTCNGGTLVQYQVGDKKVLKGAIAGLTSTNEALKAVGASLSMSNIKIIASVTNAPFVVVE